MYGIQLIWHGHACFELRADFNVLIDPFFKGNPSSKLLPDDVDPDIIFVTHGHYDHLGDTVEIAQRTGCKVIAVHELANYLKSQNVMAEGMNIGGKIQVNGMPVVMTDANHSSSISDSGQRLYGGRAAGFILQINGCSIYHAGDTGLFGDMRLIGDIYKPDVALLPIGGRYTMDPEDAARAVAMICPRIAIPMHYNTFDIISQNPVDFMHKVKDLCETEVLIMDAEGVLEL
ncbi:metal-dependent hydrolase [uncultured Methanomethylovorans sp.]|uniref:metal-dependent hydrolase n=1 Tax=uncultured Methanomethylovorans sp. TaxID=183759 RepID=UPI002AA773A7|nr:metal-dependent hydrolase [uncultured Methanomethylovorans sp.]